jgi:hypothetical protein
MITNASSASPILDRVADLDEDELYAEVERLRAEAAEHGRHEDEHRVAREQLEMAASAVAGVLVWKRSLRTGVDQNGAPIYSVGVITEVQNTNLGRSLFNLDAGDSSTVAKPRLKPRETVLRIMNDHPERETWSPEEMHAMLERAGYRGAINAVRVLLLRMSRAAEIERMGSRAYRRLDPADPGSPELGETEGRIAPEAPAV